MHLKHKELSPHPYQLFAQKSDHNRQILNNVNVPFVFEIDYDDGTVKHSTKSLGS